MSNLFRQTWLTNALLVIAILAVAFVIYRSVKSNKADYTYTRKK